ncbi:MAG: glucose-6-phosphate isomerase, partial [Novosphingobium sp.]|nr:glucose-6-phosphate isomerase [Novosphingobium sp.]
MTDTPAGLWTSLGGLPRPRLTDMFDADRSRLGALSARLDLPGGAILFDWSKTHLDAGNLSLFERLAEACGFAGWRAALFAGEVVNETEGRAAEHTAQRGVGAADSVALARHLHARMASLVGAIHQGALGEVRHLIHIGIGGSALGPALAIDALA